MGNCSLKGVADECNVIRILTDSGGVMELKGPKLVRDVINEYPDHAIFRQGHTSCPLTKYEYLVGGQFYYLLPIQKNMPPILCDDAVLASQVHISGPYKWVDETDPPEMSDGAASEQRCGGDQVAALRVLPSLGDGIWRVKMVIKTEQLEEILSEDVNTQALIESMRMAASSARSRPRVSKSAWDVARKYLVMSNVKRKAN